MAQVGFKSYYSIFIILSLIAISKATGLLKDILISFYHGVSPVTDAYFLSGSVTSLLYTAIYASIPVLVVPIYTNCRDKGHKICGQRLSEALAFYFLIAFMLSVLTLVYSDSILNFIMPSIDTETAVLANFYLPIMGLTFCLSTVTAFNNAIQAVNGSVIPSYAVPAINNVFFCVGLIVFSTSENFIYVLILGILAWLMQAIFSSLDTRSVFKFRLQSSFTIFNKKFLLLLMPAVVSLYLEQANSFVTIYFAAKLKAGSVSVFSYSNKINLVFLSVFLVFLTTSLFPKISAQVSKGHRNELNELLVGYLRIVIILGLPVVFLMAYYANEIVALLFKRGDFGIQEVIRVAKVFRIAVFGLMLIVIRDIMNRVFYAHENTMQPVFFSVLSLIVTISLSYYLYSDYGLVGLVFSSVASVFINCLLLLFFAEHEYRFNLSIPLIKIILICSLPVILSGGSLIWLDFIFQDFWFLLSVLFFIGYTFFLFLLKVTEVLNFIDFLANK